MLVQFDSFKKSEIIKKISDISFYLALLIEVLLVLVDKSEYINPIEGRMFQVTFCLFLLKVLLTEYNRREYVVLVGCIIMGLLIDYYGNRNEIIRFVIAVFSCKGIELKKGLKFVFWIQSIGCILIALISMLGIYGALTVEKEYQYEGFITRYCFGMGNANSFHTMFFVSVLLGIYIYYEVVKWWGYLILAVLNYVLFLLTDCKTATGLTFLVIIIFGIKPFIRKQSQRLLKWVSASMIALNVVLLLLSVYFSAGAGRYCKYYWDSFWEDPPNPPYILIFFDKLLTGRILSLTEYDFHGTIESWTVFTVPNHNVYFDLGWVRLFYWYGIIPAVIMVLILFYLLVWLYKKERYSELFFVSFVLFHMFVEAHFVSVYIGRSYIILMLGMLLPDILKWPVKESTRKNYD